MILKKLLYLFIDLKRELSVYKINNFFNNINTIVQQYLKVYIIKPNVLVESEDTGFKNIGLYNLKDSVLNSMTFEERLSIYNRIKINQIKVNNCIYFSFNEKEFQPIIFTIWALGEELRIGCFISNNLHNIVLEKQKEKINRLFKMFETSIFLTKYNEIQRNDYYLTEIIITNRDEKSIYDSIEKQNFIAQIFAVVISQNILEYIENTEKVK